MSITEHKSYPQPVEDTDNTEYLEGWRRGSLLLQQCNSCKEVIFYPRPMCPYCWSDSLIWIKASGRGTVVSYSLIHRPNHPSFADEVPVTLAEIKLEEGTSMLARVLTEHIHTGMNVELADDPESVRKYPLPIFRPS